MIHSIIFISWKLLKVLSSHNLHLLYKLLQHYLPMLYCIWKQTTCLRPPYYANETAFNWQLMPTTKFLWGCNVQLYAGKFSCFLCCLLNLNYLFVLILPRNFKQKKCFRINWKSLNMNQTKTRWKKYSVIFHCQ